MRKAHSAFTLVELLTIVAIVGILMAILFPAVLSTRAASRRAACGNNLRQIGVALWNYEAARGHFPAGNVLREGNKVLAHSWSTSILPFLDYVPLHDRYDRRLAWNEGPNLAVAATDVPVFLCPGSGHTTPGGTDYGGSYGSSLSGLEPGFGLSRAWDSGVMLMLNAPTFDGKLGPTRTQPIRTAQVRDGTSKTIIVVEDAGRNAEFGGSWAHGENCVAHEWGRINENRQNGIFGEHLDGAHVLMVDGSLRFLSEPVRAVVLGAMTTRAGE